MRKEDIYMINYSLINEQILDWDSIKYPENKIVSELYIGECFGRNSVVLYSHEEENEDLNFYIMWSFTDDFKLHYFKICRYNINSGIKCCRISMTECKYLESNFYLTKAEKAVFVSNIDLIRSNLQIAIKKIKETSYFNNITEGKEVEIADVDYSGLETTKFGEYIKTSSIYNDELNGCYWIPTIICRDVNLHVYLSSNIDGSFYFLIKDDKLTSSYSCRISMKDAKYLESDFNLTKDQKESFVNHLNDKNENWWKAFISILNSERDPDEFVEIPVDLPMPDYSKLETNEEI